MSMSIKEALESKENMDIYLENEKTSEIINDIQKYATDNFKRKEPIVFDLVAIERKKIATAAMQALISSGYYDTTSEQHIAITSIKLADALIEELKK